MTNTQNNPGNVYENEISTIHTIKILFESGASASIVCKDVLYEHYGILKDKKNRWSTIAGTLNTTFVTEIKLKLPKLNHSTKFTENAIWSINY